MIKYQQWLDQCITKKQMYGISYREIGRNVNTIFQNINHIFLKNKMPSLESGRSIDEYFNNEIKFEDYVKQFAELCEGYSDEFLAEYLGVHKLTVRNLLECKHVARVETYEKIEGLIEMEEEKCLSK